MSSKRLFSGSGIIQYSLVSPFDYNGAFYYLRLNLKL